MLAPTLYEVQFYTHTLHQKHDHRPGISARIDKAAAIFAAGDIFPAVDCWSVGSQSDDSRRYIVRYGCECPDSANGAPVLGGIKYCKHKIAAGMWERMIADRLRERYIYNANGADNQRQRSRPRTWLQVGTPTRGASYSTLWSESVGILCRVSYNAGMKMLAPVSVADYIKALGWLEVAEELPRTMAEELPDASEWKSQLTAEQYSRWIKTGITV